MDTEKEIKRQQKFLNGLSLLTVGVLVFNLAASFFMLCSNALNNDLISAGGFKVVTELKQLRQDIKNIKIPECKPLEEKQHTHRYHDNKAIY